MAESSGRPKKTSTETNRQIIVLAKNYIFNSSDAISIGIFIEIGLKTICPRFLMENVY